MRELPKEQRYNAALQILQHYYAIQEEKKRLSDSVTERKPVSKTIFEIAAIVMAAGCLALAEFKLPPASYIARGFMNITGGNSYYPC